METIEEENVGDLVQRKAVEYGKSAFLTLAKELKKFRTSELVHTSWLMFCRRILLTYFVFCAMLFIAIFGLSFGICEFYVYRDVDLNYTGFVKTTGKKTCVCGGLIFSFLILSSVFSKCIEIIYHVIWSNEQYIYISKKAIPMLRFCKIKECGNFSLHLIIQTGFILVFEVSPLLITVIVMLATQEKDYTFYLRYFFLFGSIGFLLMSILWWLGTVVENYRRLVFYIFNIPYDSTIPSFDEDLKSQEQNKKKTKENKNKKNEEAEEEGKEVKETERSPFLSPSSINGDSSQEEQEEKDPTMEHDFDHEELMQFRNRDLDKNIWVLCVYLCFFWRPCRWFTFRYCWYFFGLVLCVIIVAVLAGFFTWKFIIIFLVLVVEVIINMLLNLFVYIPRRDPLKNPKKHTFQYRNLRQICCRPFCCTSFWCYFCSVERYVYLFEEVYFHSPWIVFWIIKYVVYFMIFFITVFVCFNLSSVFIFIFPTINLVLVGVCYIFRFNSSKFCCCLCSIFGWEVDTFKEEKKKKDEDVVDSIVKKNISIQHKDHQEQTSPSYGSFEESVDDEEENENLYQRQQQPKQEVETTTTSLPVKEEGEEEGGEEIEIVVDETKPSPIKKKRVLVLTPKTPNLIPFFADPEKSKVKDEEYFSYMRDCYQFLDDKHESVSFRYISVIFLNISLLGWCLFFIICVFCFTGWISGLISLVVIFLLSFVVFDRVRKTKYLIRACFFLFFFVLVSLVFIIGFMGNNGNVDDSTSSSNRRSSDDEKWSEDVKKYNTYGRYFLCDAVWNEVAPGFRVVDFALLSAMSYDSYGKAGYFLTNYLPEFCDTKNNTCDYIRYTKGTVVFYEIIFKQKVWTSNNVTDQERQFSVISVRGTSSPLDWIQDAFIWKEIALLQGASLFSPILPTLGEDLASRLIWFYSWMEKLLVGDYEKYYAELDKYVKDNNLENQKSILTGHSLGGGLAKIVGASNNVSAVTFAAPGLGYTARKLGIEDEELNRIAVNVKPNLDIVSQIDSLKGDVQSIACEADDPLNCHSIARIVASFNDACDFDVKIPVVTS